MRLFRAAALLLVLTSAALASAQEADFAVTKTGPEIANAGANVTYRVSVANLGPDAAVVTLSDAIPAGMTFFSATQVSGATSFTCTTPLQGDPGSVSCTSDAAMPASETAEFDLVFTIDQNSEPGTTFTNIATVSTQALDPNEENNASTAVTSTPPPPQADMGVTKTGPGTAGPGTDVTYTITVFNNGPDTAEDVVLSDTLPGTLTLVSFDASPSNTGPAMNCTTPAAGSGGTITCTADTFAAGTSNTFTLVAHVPDETTSGTVTNTVTVSTSTVDPNEEDDSSLTELTVSNVDVSVTKTGPVSGTAGQDVTYSILVSNAGPDAATIELTDVTPAGTTFATLVQSGAICSTPAPNSAGTVQCTFALGVNQSSTFTLTLHTDPSITSVTNTADARVLDVFDRDTTNNTSTATTPLSAVSDLGVAKSGPATATPGTNLSYTVTVTNNGPSTATSVSLTDAIPTGTTFVSATQNSGPAFDCSGSGASGIVCTIASLVPSSPATFTFVFAVDPAATGMVSNTAAIDSATVPDPNSNNDSSTSVVALVPAADVGVTKSGPATTAPGGNVTYTVVVNNVGPSTATGVSLSDTLPPGTTPVSATQDSGPLFTCTNTPAAVSCTIASLAPSSPATFTLVFAVDAASTGTLTNTAIVSSPIDTNGNNNTSSTTAALVASADLTAAKNGSTTATPGSTAVYTITVENNGPSTATNVTVTDTLPAGTTFLFGAQNFGPFFNCSYPDVGSTGTITCTTASFEPASPAMFTFNVRIDPSATGTLTNTARITSTTTADPNPDNNTGSKVTTLTASADVGVVKNGPATATPGTDITYTVTASNSGPSTATNVVLTDILPVGQATFVSLAQNSGLTFNCTTPAVGSEGTITCTRATMIPASSATFTFVFHVVPSAVGFIGNTARIRSDVTDPNTGNDSSQTLATLTPSADLAVTKNGPTGTPAGSNASYTVTVTNNGPSGATNVRVTDLLPPGTTFVSATQNSGPTFTCTNAPTPTTVSCTIATFPAAAAATFTFVATVPISGSGSLVNTAQVRSDTNDPVPENNTATSTATIAPAADLALTKFADTDRYRIGTPITYSIAVRNNGPIAASDVSVSDLLPAGTTLRSVTSSQGSCSGTTTVVCTLGTMASGGTANITLVVDAPATPAVVTNTAVVTSSTPELNPLNNSGTSVVTVAVDIPTLSEWMLIVLGLTLAAAAMMAIRRS
ncbi:MAG TPA: IPTL-CTERM sorting domain-containing protein [Thermoanaerobaculia bacterium]|jgi:uncharacterized repeat protein (TIGR01451 family)